MTAGAQLRNKTEQIDRVVRHPRSSALPGKEHFQETSGYYLQENKSLFRPRGPSKIYGAYFGLAVISL